jgi:DNA-binding response OmpR family regulator
MPPVLVIEDDPSTRQLLATCLQLEGFPVTTASNGAEGLERMKQEHPCLVLLDLMMPIMNGEQFRAAQLEDRGLADVPIVCISAMHDAERRARLLHAIACISKPFDLDQIVRVVRCRCLDAKG